MRDIFFEVHQDLPREAPGSTNSTRRAYEMLTGLPPHARILDLGCGPGAQTVLLAQLSGGMVCGFDLHFPFLRELQRRATAASVLTRTWPVRMSMFDLGFTPSCFDLVWSEGAVYIRGFDDCLRAFLPLLKPGGFVAVTEASWLRPDPPEEIRAFWEAYPAMRSVEENRAASRSLGYHEIGHFTLPRSDWMDYLNPMGRRIDMLRNKYYDNPEALRTLDEIYVEVKLFPKYLDWFGYEFYKTSRLKTAQSSVARMKGGARSAN
jgi:trans-aconitate methyltransferase